MKQAKLAPTNCATETLFDNYHVGWETRNSDLIVSLHSENTVFHMHDGSEPVVGREALTGWLQGSPFGDESSEERIVRSVKIEGKSPLRD